MALKKKEEHLLICLTENVSSAISTGLEDYQFINQAVPEVAFNNVDMRSILFGKTLKIPIIISSISGGSEETSEINCILAEAAQFHGMAMGVGSQRIALENPELSEYFQVRKVAQDILLFANIGAVQLNYGHGIESCKKCVNMIEADAIILHFNPLQETLLPEGNTDFSHLLRKVELLCKGIGVPVIAKEVGFGISEKTATQLQNAGVAAIDVAGAGGTSWSEVEKYRIKDPIIKNVAASFRAWGIPTALSITLAKKGAHKLPIIASGGIANGIDLAKCLALGASACGIALPFLKAAKISYKAVDDYIIELTEVLKRVMFATGSRSIPELQKAIHKIN